VNLLQYVGQISGEAKWKTEIISRESHAKTLRESSHGTSEAEYGVRDDERFMYIAT